MTITAMFNHLTTTTPMRNAFNVFAPTPCRGLIFISLDGYARS